MHGVLVDNLAAMWWIALAALLGPILALVTRRAIPDVVWLLVLGMVIGPHVLGVAHQTEPVEFLRELGMGFLFLLAGFEVSPTDMRGRQGARAMLTWIVSVVLGVGAAMLFVGGEWRVAVVFAIAATSTALGTLLPILKDAGAMGTPLGRATMVHGAYGELLPIVAMSLLLTTRATWQVRWSCSRSPWPLSRWSLSRRASSDGYLCWAGRSSPPRTPPCRRRCG